MSTWTVQRNRRWRTPPGKLRTGKRPRCYPKNRVVYDTLEEAEAARVRYRSRGMVQEVYLCPWGHHYHLTGHPEERS